MNDGYRKWRHSAEVTDELGPTFGWPKGWRAVVTLVAVVQPVGENNDANSQQWSKMENIFL